MSREQALRKIVAEHQAAEIEGVMVDAFTASMLVQVLDNLRPENKAKFLNLPLCTMAQVGWRITNP